MRQLVKSAALSLLRSTGAFALSGNSARRRARLLILCYHGISLRDEHLWEGALYMTADLFRQRLEALRTLRANVLPLGDALHRLQAGTLPPRSVVITFDDGFYDFLSLAVPLLREFSAPATLYLTTHYTRHPYAVFNPMASYLLWKSNRPVIDWPEIELAPSPNRTLRQRRVILDALGRFADARHLDTAAKEALLRRLAVHLGIAYEELHAARMFHLVTPDEAAEISRAGFDLQLHTHRHRTPRDRDLFVREIRDNRDCLRQITGVEPVHFCYPSGDYTPDFFPWLQELGIRSATTCEAGLARRDSEPMRLPRVLDGQQVSALEFERWVCGFA